MTSRRAFLAGLLGAGAAGTVADRGRSGPATVAPDQWHTFQHDLANTGYAGVFEGPVTGIETAWSADVGAPVYAQPVYDGKTVVASGVERGADAGRLVALGTDGAGRWSASPSVSILSTPTIDGRTLYRTTPERIEALAVDDGSRRWSRQVPASLFPSPVVAGDAVLVGARTGDLRALSIADGSELWRTGLDGVPAATPAVGEDSVVTATTTGEAAALALGDGSEVWRRSVGAAVRAPVTVAGDAAVVAAEDGRLVAFDLASGDRRWGVSADVPTVSSPVAADGSLYWTGGSTVYALDAADGSRDWTVSTGGYSGLNRVAPAPVASQSHLYVTTGHATVRALSRVDGSEHWTFSPPSGADALSVSVAAGRVYVGTADGRLHALDGRTNYPPSAAFTYAPRDPAPGETVTFDAGDATDRDGGLAEFRWDFDGDGTVDATGRTVTRAFDPGTYPVALEVVDDEGATARTTLDSPISVAVTTTATTAGQSESGGPGGVVGGLSATELGAGAVGVAGVAGLALVLARRGGSQSGPTSRETADGTVDGGDAGGSGDPSSGDPVDVVWDEPTRGGDSSERGRPAVPDAGVEFEDVEPGVTIGTGRRTRVQEATVDGADEGVALETLAGPETGTVDASLVESFREGLEVWEAIDDHDNVVSVLATGSDPFPWAVIERCTGRFDPTDLAGATVGAKRDLLGSLIEGVHHGHRYGVEHGALSPHNVLSVRGGGGPISTEPVVGDWRVTAPALDPAVEVADLYPRFAAPEQRNPGRYGEPDVLTDVYQLGVHGYALFTGSYPAGAPGEWGTDIRPASERAPDAPDALDDVLSTVLAPDPDDRFETALHFRDALDRL